MKLAFSTLGCPDWSWNETVATAKDLGYDGIELRGIEHQMYLPKALQLVGDQLKITTKHLNEIGLTISCLTSACYLHEADFEAALKVGEEYITLASQMGVPFVRVLGDTNPEPGFKPFPRSQVSEGLKLLGKKAGQQGVTVLIETNGHLADSKLLADLLEEVAEPNVGVLWDLHHPYRFFNEEPQLTTSRLGKLIKYVHIKDSQLLHGQLKYCMLGTGDIPVKESLKALKAIGYTGWLSLEWVKKWNPDIEEPGVVFPHFISTIERYLKEV